MMRRISLLLLVILVESCVAQEVVAQEDSCSYLQPPGYWIPTEYRIPNGPYLPLACFQCGGAQTGITRDGFQCCQQNFYDGCSSLSPPGFWMVAGIRDAHTCSQCGGFPANISVPVARSLRIGAPYCCQTHSQKCRVCPDRCQTVPREGGGCPICICDGVVKADCKRTTCQAGCRKELDAEGCNACICDPICSAVHPCLEGCEHKLNGDGCSVCDCGDNNNPPSVNPVEPITPVNDTSPDEECPKVSEVVCGGECEPRAGPDGCPVCVC